MTFCKNMKILLTLILVTASAGHLLAARGGGFWHKGLAERSTEIVLVTEGLKIDGVVTVLATYKGDIGVGTTVNLPALTKYSDSKNRVTASAFWAKRINNPEHSEVTCSTMILFLTTEDGKSSSYAFTNGYTWINWIEDGIGYARNNENYPGKSEIREYYLPLETVLEDISKKQNKTEMATPRKPSD